MYSHSCYFIRNRKNFKNRRNINMRAWWRKSYFLESVSSSTMSSTTENTHFQKITLEQKKEKCSLSILAMCGCLIIINLGASLSAVFAPLDALFQKWRNSCCRKTTGFKARYLSSRTPWPETNHFISLGYKISEDFFFFFFSILR